METLTIFVLCHNRPDFVRQTLYSVQSQRDADFQLVVSDNSSTNDVEAVVRSEFPELDYRRRVPALEPLAHFNRCIDEAKTDYFCLFHDDDLMDAEFVQEMKAVLDRYPQAIAAGCNARTESLGKIEPRPSFRSLGQREWINSPRDLARRYFARAQSGFAPFPGYVYRTSAVGTLRILEDGGKYGDVTWLLRLAMKGRMVWIRRPLMTYRIHGGNDGSTESPRDRLRFLSFLKSNLNALGKDVLADYRCSFIYKPLMRNFQVPDHRRDLARRFLRYYSWSRYSRPSLYGALLRRALIKRVAE
jgi:GT2 family glycosyltransferase